MEAKQSDAAADGRGELFAAAGDAASLAEQVSALARSAQAKLLGGDARGAWEDWGRCRRLCGRLSAGVAGAVNPPDAPATN